MSESVWKSIQVKVVLEWEKEQLGRKDETNKKT